MAASSRSPAAVATWPGVHLAAQPAAPADGSLPMWAGGLVFAAYGLAPALLGGRLVVRRDLT